MAKKKKNPFAAYNRARKAAKAKKKKPASAGQRRTKSTSKPKRRNMAKRKKSAVGGKRRTSRRSSGSRSNKTMDILMQALLMGGGFVLGGAAQRMIPLETGTMRGGALAVGAALLAPMAPVSMMPVMIGIAARGVVGVAQELIPGVAGIGDLGNGYPALSQEQVDELEMALLEGVNGDYYQENLMGLDDRGAALMGDDDGGGYDDGSAEV